MAELSEQLAPSSSGCVSGRLELAEKKAEIFFCLLLGSSVSLFRDIVLIFTLLLDTKRVLVR